MARSIAGRVWFSLWRLVPANPILVRVVGGSSKRVRHLWLRAAYLALILFVVLLGLSLFMGSQSGLNELAKGASKTFKYASYMQLALMCFLAPVFTAGAITQERDAKTYNILLSTPLTNAQIVLGSLISRLYFLIMLLVAGLPIFFTTMVYGGVTSRMIMVSFALSASTAIVTGALAIFISVLRVGTRRTIFSFYMVIALYLLSIYLLGNWRATWVELAPENISGQQMSALSALHPFLSLEVALNFVRAPDISLLSDRGTIMRYALAHPAGTYIAWTLGLGVLLTTLSMFFVRSGAREGEETFLTKLLDRFRRTSSGERRRKPRHVWKNPVAWREAKTKASSGSGGLMRWGLILGGSAFAVGLLVEHLTDPKAFSVQATQQWLAAVIMIEFAIALLIATNTSATSITKEKESRSMDVLMTTPLTSQYIVFGKLRGLVSSALPMIAVPVLSLLLFGIVSLFRDGNTALAWIEAPAELAVSLVLYVALGCVICLKFSLKSKKTVKAVMTSMAFMLAVTGIVTAVGFAFLNTDPHVGAFVAPFTPFTAVWAMVYPAGLVGGSATRLSQNGVTLRTAMLFGSIVSALIYAVVVWSIYKALVSNFDMDLRKQTASG